MRLFSKSLNQNGFTRFLKNKRNAALNWYFIKQLSPEQYESVKILKSHDSLVFSIAFNKPECIRIMIDSWVRHASHTTLVIVDNSSHADARKEIKKLCNTNGFLYISLPKNPEWHPNRSHALAMNWIFYNIVKKCNPEQFGYLDHDCFPFKSFSLEEKLDDYLIYGEKRESAKFADVWKLWAGFCFFNYEFVKERKINFTHSIELGLDTGGGNWPEIYRNIDQEKCKFSIVSPMNKLKSKSKQKFSVVIDGFVHIGSMSHVIKGKEIYFDELNKLFEKLKGYKLDEL